MNNRLYRQGAALLLLGSLILQITGPAALRLCRRYQLKSEIRAAIFAGMPLDAITTFSFPLSNGEKLSPDFFWEEKGEEFTYQGHWYDVMSMDTDGQEIKIQAIEDGRDDQLEKAWKQIESSGQPTHSSKNILVKSFSVFLPDHADYTSYLPPTGKKRLSLYQLTMLQRAVDVPELPPGFCI